MVFLRHVSPERGFNALRYHMKTELTQERLKELLHYDPETGVFTWLKRCGATTTGNKAGHLHTSGYITIRIDKTSYRAHRLAWFYTHGVWPSELIDHVNLVRSDNRFCNLREVTHLQNHWNRQQNKNSTSGHKGVYQCTKSEKFVVKIMCKRKIHYFGRFNSYDEACNVADIAYKKLQGSFAYRK